MTAPLRRAVFFDRDGILNHARIENGKPFPPGSPHELRIVAGARDALTGLERAGYLLIGVTNQPDVSRGTQRREVVEAINAALLAALPLDEISVCYHDDPDDCSCRKPRPGLLTRAAAQYSIDLTQSWMVGDRWKDVEAGRRAGCRTILIGDGYGEGTGEGRPDRQVTSLLDAARWILGEINPKEARVRTLAELKVKIFADGADLQRMLEMYRNPLIQGFTTNPTLMRKAGITDYRAFALEVLAAIPDRPISFEVFADDEAEMERQAREIARWGSNVYVKIPVTNTSGQPTLALAHRLSVDGIKVNVTALMTPKQVRAVAEAIVESTPCYVSVFAGRIADTGRDPLPIMAEAVDILRRSPLAELIWASPRELLNVFQADSINCHVITATNDILNKLSLVGKNLDQYSLETVRMFREDAIRADFQL